jgi:hypothetical protein
MYVCVSENGFESAYYRYHTNQLLNAVIAVVAPLVIYQSTTLQDCII